MKVCNEWKDFELIDAGHGEKLERWKNIIVRRPDPQAIWKPSIYESWNNIDGYYHRSDKGGGYWDLSSTFHKYIIVSYKELNFKIAPTNFKHMGLFPEQAINWDYMISKIKTSGRPIKVLNLFAYTGGATMACSYAGAMEVVHVDSSKGIIQWAKENMHISHLENNKIRFIADDCLKFVLREARRGNKYDVIIMDPPSYGRGSNGEVWKFENDIEKLINSCINILSDQPLFFQINSYTTGISPIVLENILKKTIGEKYLNGMISSDEIGLPITSENLILPCGLYARWEEK